MLEVNKIPYLRVCVTEKCGNHCVYCRPGGEASRVADKKEMSLRQIYALVDILSKKGISDIKITGGEPLERKDLPKMVELISSIRGIKRVELVTRSPKVGKIATALKDCGLSCLNFSLDSLDPYTFFRITGGRRLDLLMQAIKHAAKSGMPLKFNMVVMKGINDHEISSMIEFAGRFRAVLKLLDLMNMPKDAKFLSKYYMPLDGVVEMLSKKALKQSMETPPGGIGTPMPKFEMPNGSVVMIKDARKGTWYGDTCKECKHYPCQDALMALRITSDGCLQRCLLRDDNLVDLLSLLEDVADQEIIDVAIKAVLQTYKAAVFYKDAWNI